MIIDGRGRLVWFRQLPPPTVATNLRLQRYSGRKVLTWWQGQVTIAAFGLGEGIIANTRYHTLKVVHVGNGYQADLHEFRLTRSGDALFTVNSLVMIHLPGTAPGTRSPVLDSILQAVDIRTGLVTWEWHALGHIPLADSYATAATSAYFDAYHMNSIEPLAHNRLLVSARDTAAIYEIDRATGRIIWTLGGKASSFRMQPGSRFFFQHDASMLPGNRVSLFDDEAGPPIKASSSRGLILALDLRHHTARVARQYHRPDGAPVANSEGSFQTLPGGNLFVGFGSTPFFSDFSPSGALLFDARLPTDDGSYREFTFPWSATPTTRPKAVARSGTGGHVVVYASWNGATTVARWQVLAASGSRPPKLVGSAASRSFETRVAVRSSATRFAVRALNSRGKVLATSAVVHAS